MDTNTTSTTYEYALQRLEDSPLHKQVKSEEAKPVNLQFSDSLAFDDEVKGS